MQRVVYVDGQWLEEAKAQVSVFDRGFLFGDGVYEVTAVVAGRLVDFEAHVSRLRRSANEIALRLALSDDDLRSLHMEIIARNGLEEGIVYLQLTRGAADRDHVFPPDTVPSTLVMFTQRKNIVRNPVALRGISVITVPDQRWARRDIKSVQLLPSVLAKMQARAAGADDAWLVDGEYVTEGTASSAFIASRNGEIITRNLSAQILPGTTRSAIIGLADRRSLKIVERPFAVSEIYEAAEAFTTGTGNPTLSVIRCNGVAIGEGTPGPIARELRALYIDGYAQGRAGSV